MVGKVQIFNAGGYQPPATIPAPECPDCGLMMNPHISLKRESRLYGKFKGAFICKCGKRVEVK